MAPFRAVLFDLDGTLLDTLADLAESMNAVLAAEGLPVHPRDPYRYFVGDGLRTMVARALPEARREEEPLCLRCMAAMRDEYARRWKNASRPYDGVPAMLDGLVERGVPMAVLSNKPDDFTRLMVEALLDAWSFRDVRGARESVPPKPDPAGAFASAEVLGVPPETILYLGDTATDMRTARAAGMVPVGALWGFRTEDELRDAGAAALVARPEEVLRLVDEAI